jgi:hypothetical protein
MNISDKVTLRLALAAPLFLHPPLQAPSHQKLKNPITSSGAGLFLIDLHTILSAASSFVRPAARRPLASYRNVNLILYSCSPQKIFLRGHLAVDMDGA